MRKTEISARDKACCNPRVTHEADIAMELIRRQVMKMYVSNICLQHGARTIQKILASVGGEHDLPDLKS